jgi:hypothetical protein
MATPLMAAGSSLNRGAARATQLLAKALAVGLVQPVDGEGDGTGDLELIGAELA